MSVHIALVGRTKEPSLIGFRHYGSISALHLLHSPNSESFNFKNIAYEIRSDLAGIGFTKVDLYEIDAFDMNNITETILKIYQSTREKAIFINITGGTNLMAAAACASAFMIGARAYYVLDTRKANMIEKNPIIELPIPTIPFIRILDSNQVKILKALINHDGLVSNRELRNDLDISPQKLSYHIKRLSRTGLITTERGFDRMTKRGDIIKDTRILGVSVTNAGRLAAKMILT